MTEAPEYFADRPAADDPGLAAANGDPAHDVLSELLKSVRLRGERIFCCEPASPFAISFDHPGGTLHLVQRGEFDLQLEGEKVTRRYARGDAILLPSAQAHAVRDGRHVARRPLAATDLRSSNTSDQ